MFGLWLSSITAGALVTFISVATTKVSISNITAAFSLLLLMLFGGFLVNGRTMPGVVSWIKYISFIFYANEAVLSSELDGIIINILPESISLTASVPIAGALLIKDLGMQIGHIERNFGILAVFIAGFFAFAYGWLYFFVKERK